MKNNNIPVLFSGLLALFVTHVSNAALINIPPANVSSSSEIGAPFDRQDDFLVDGSGLGSGQHGIDPDGFMWLSTGTAFGGDDLDPFVMFDLGAVYTISSFRVWNYNETVANPAFPGRGVNAVTVEYGLLPALGSTVPGITNFAIAPGVATYAGELFNGFGTFDAQYIRFDINSNHGGDNNFYGLSEVQFDGVLASTVPEPSSVLLSAICLLGCIVGWRRFASPNSEWAI